MENEFEFELDEAGEAIYPSLSDAEARDVYMAIFIHG